MEKHLSISSMGMEGPRKYDGFFLSATIDPLPPTGHAPPQMHIRRRERLSVDFLTAVGRPSKEQAMIRHGNKPMIDDILTALHSLYIQCLRFDP